MKKCALIDSDVRRDWPARLAGGAGAGAGMALMLLFGRTIGIDGFWPGIIAAAVACGVGALIGRLLGGLLLRPSSGRKGSS